jgi:MFS transporter, ACS family, tartrate transporter
MSFASGGRSFYTLRFLLGVAEAGFFPASSAFSPIGIRRGTTRLCDCRPVSTGIGAPVSGLLLGLDRARGPKGIAAAVRHRRRPVITIS